MQKFISCISYANNDNIPIMQHRARDMGFPPPPKFTLTSCIKPVYQ